MMRETECLILLYLWFGMLVKFWLNLWGARGTSYHPAFMVNCATIIHMFLALFIKWMNCPSRKLRYGASRRFHLVVFMFCVNEEKWGTRGVEDSPMVESFSAHLPAIESDWTESHLEIGPASTTEFLCESMWSTFRCFG